MNDITLLLNSIHFAADKHRDQRRKGADASPYINHPIAVAQALAEIGGIADIKTLAAAILHDTIEDTETTHADLISKFAVRGKVVADPAASQALHDVINGVCKIT